MPATEGKYGIITTTGKQFHLGEPVFILRATDPLAPDAIRHYSDLCEIEGCSSDHVDAVQLHADRIELWQKENPALVKKLPD